MGRALLGAWRATVNEAALPAQGWWRGVEEGCVGVSGTLATCVAPVEPPRSGGCCLGHPQHPLGLGVRGFLWRLRICQGLGAGGLTRTLSAPPPACSVRGSEARGRHRVPARLAMDLEPPKAEIRSATRVTGGPVTPRKGPPKFKQRQTRQFKSKPPKKGVQG